MDGIIYQAKNTITGKSYIGQTINGLTTRKHQHRSDANKKCRYYFHNAIRKHGFENFEWSVLVEGKTMDELNVLELQYIEKLGTLFPNGYNLTTGGKNGLPSEATRAKMSIASKGNKRSVGRKFSEETKKKMSISHLGYKHTDEARKNMSLAHMGNKNSLGYKHTEKAKKKMSKARIGNKYNLGKQASEETKKKMSTIHRGEGNGSAKLTEKDVLTINRKLGEGVPGVTLAKEFNVTRPTICAIHKGRTWNHLTGNK